MFERQLKHFRNDVLCPLDRIGLEKWSEEENQISVLLVPSGSDSPVWILQCFSNIEWIFRNRWGRWGKKKIEVFCYGKKIADFFKLISSCALIKAGGKAGSFRISGGGRGGGVRMLFKLMLVSFC